MSYNLQQDSWDYPDLEEVLQRSSDEWLGSEDVNNIFTLHEDPTLSLDPVDEMIAGLFMYSNWSVLDTHVWDTFDDGETIRNKMTREAPNPMRYTVSRMLLAPIAEGVRSTYERRVYTPRHDFAECVLAHYRFVNVDGEDPEDSSGEDVEDSEDSEDPEDSSGEDSEDSEDPGNDSSDDSGDDGGENLVEEGIEDDSEEDAGVGEDDPTDSEPEDAPHSPSCNGHVVLKAMDGNIPGSEYENHTSQILQSLGARVQKTKKTVELTVTPDFQWDDIIHKYVGRLYNNVEDNDGEKQYFLLKKQYTDEDHTLNFTVPIFEPLPPQYFVSVVSDRWIGSQTVLPVSFRHLILPKNCPPPTELLELQPFPETALKNQNYERFYQDCKHFNPVQNQVLTLLNNMNDNVLVVAPTGCGKIIFAEFAILRKYEEGPDAMRLSYIAQLEAIAKKQFLIWERKFVKGLCLRVVEVIGETALDIKLLEKGPIIISTPEKWDTLSRRWKQRKYAQLVSLFILNELHLIGGQGSPALEVIISRMRYISSQANNKIRISALSTFLTSAKDFWEWIGASSHDLFNVPPGFRPVPLEIHIQGLDFEARMQAMTKPTYTTIVQHAKNKKRAIVFVPTFKHIHLTAVDLMVYSHIDNSQSPDFLLGKLEVLEPCVGQIRKETLRHGVGFLCEVLSSLDQEIMTQLFEARRIQVFVMRIIEGETMRYSARNLSSMAMTTRISLSKLPRGNNEVMARGTFANIRIVNKLLKGEVGPKTVHIPTGEKLSVFDAASKCKTAGQDKIILAGAEYGSGSSQDWLQRVPCFWTTEPSRSGSSFRPETWQPPS